MSASNVATRRWPSPSPDRAASPATAPKPYPDQTSYPPPACARHAVTPPPHGRPAHPATLHAAFRAQLRLPRQGASSAVPRRPTRTAVGPPARNRSPSAGVHAQGGVGWVPVLSRFRGQSRHTPAATHQPRLRNADLTPAGGACDDRECDEGQQDPDHPTRAPNPPMSWPTIRQPVHPRPSALGRGGTARDEINTTSPWDCGQPSGAGGAASPVASNGSDPSSAIHS